MTNHMADARYLLGKMLQLHLDSVRIGQLEAVAESGVVGEEIHRTRALIERADRLCAEMDRAGQA